MKKMKMEELGPSLEETPIWAFSVVCLVLVLFSFIVQGALGRLTKFLKARKKKSLNRALRKIKTELMLLGLISLLLTVTEIPISEICVTKSVGKALLPCRSYEEATEEMESSNEVDHEEINDEASCEAKGMVSLLSKGAVEQLHIFIFVLAVFHVLHCVITMCLGIAKMKRWKSWEQETQTLDYQIANDPRRFRLTHQTSYGRRHLRCWSDNPFFVWPVCFVRQFRGSVTKSDYFTLRNGFLTAHIAQGNVFDFQKFLVRAYDGDFQHVVGISLWIWILSVVFIFFCAHGFYNYYWLPFIPLLLLLIVGTKLEVIMTKMCVESSRRTKVVRGTLLVEPKDTLFWFNRPQLVLHLIHFVLFQNSFQLAFFTWTWYEYGLRSCFHRETKDIIIRISMGLIVQFLCGYITLPLYALVTQMGSSMKAAVFTERIVKGLKRWHNHARRNLSKSKFNLDRHSTNFREFPLSDLDLRLAEFDHLPSPSDMSSPALKIHDEASYQKIIKTGIYIGEISFGPSWKGLERIEVVEDITSAVEDATELY